MTVIDGSKTNDNTETVSAQCIADAYKFFTYYLKGQETETIEKLLNAIKTASCTTYIVENETEAIQIFKKHHYWSLFVYLILYLCSTISKVIQ